MPREASGMITYHHIGGRNGTYPLPLKKGKLLQDFHLVLYDADADCLQQMEKAEKGSWGKTSIYPYCIGRKSGNALFNINFHATTSSLYDFNEELADYTFVANPLYGQYRLGDACKLGRQIEVELFSLEEALTKAGNKALDFLSLDVQGAEYDVLIGAQEFLAENCLGFQLEVEFLKIYKEQKVFSDINTLLTTMNFELIELDSLGRLAPISMPIGFRGLEQPIYAEAIYLKKIDSVVATGDKEKLYKWCLFSLAYQKVGLCLQGLDKLAEMDDLQKISPNDPGYVVLLKKIRQLVVAQQQRQLPHFSEVFSHELLQSFYRGEKQPDLSLIQKKQEINHYLAKHYAPLLAEIREEEARDVSAFEALLVEYGLETVATIVKKNRVAEINCFLTLIAPLSEMNC